MQSQPLALVFDIGTQSTRAILFDQQGDIVAKAKKEEPLYLSDVDCRAEKPCDVFWSGICSVSQQLRGMVTAEQWQSIAAVSVTSIRNSLVFLDKDNNPTRNAILWLDKREVECPDPLPLFNRMLYALAGMSETVKVSRRTTYANWVRVNEPQVWAKTAKVVMPSAWFQYCLTGRLADSKAGQAAKIPYDYRHRRWMSKHALNYPIFGCEVDKMCELVEPGEVLGHITPEASQATGIAVGTPVIAAGADKACETLGCGCIVAHKASISLGTAASVEITTRRYVEPETFMPAYTSVAPDCYNPEIQIFRGYWMVSWFKKQYAVQETQLAQQLGVSAESLLDRKLEEIPPGSNGLVLLPSWGPGLKTPEAKGAIVGFSDVHTRMHIYRAIIEGIAYGLLDGLENLESRAMTHVDRCSISGGGSNSDIVCQITADIFGREIYRVQTYETSGLGAAILCFRAIGTYRDLQTAVDRMVHETTVFRPDPARQAIYRSYYTRVYKKLTRQLKPLNDELYQLLKRH